MPLKDDTLKAPYNIQAGTQDSFVTSFSVSQNANDATAFIAHMKRREELALPCIRTVTAHSVYGTEENYHYMKYKMKGVKCYLKYPSFHRELAGKLSPFAKENFVYNKAKDKYICPNGKRVVFKEERERKTESGFKYKLRIYECKNCSSCLLPAMCKKGSGNRKIAVNLRLEKYRKQAIKNLVSEKGIELRKRRGHEVDTPFADIKQNMGILRGLEKVKTEMAIIFTSYNFRKLALAW